jgi:3-carboxy-cis,cis-muconate cycloisomerase
LTAFEGLFVPREIAGAVSDRAWLEAMLDVERALASAEALAGAVPAAAAAAISEQCEPSLYDAAALLAEGRAPGNPVEPLVRAIRGRVGGDAAALVHLGATSQDVLDSAAMLVSRRAIALVRADLDALADACADLARAHRSTPAMARTLLQQAVPTTFGARVAGWLVGVLDAREALDRLRFPAQLGGAAGTLAPLGADALRVLSAFAAELDLEEPVVPWHTHRAPIAAIGAALDGAAAACAKVGVDVVLLAQTEVGEVSPREGGRSSAMPHKRNPVDAVLARACARVVHANVSLLGGGDQELERAAGAWHAEWPALSTALAYAGGVAAAVRTCVEGLEAHADRMRANLGDGTPDLGSAEAFVDRALARHGA